MKNTIIRYILILGFGFLLAEGCSDNTTIPVQGNSISGHVTFADTHFVSSGGQYEIALYPNEYPPFFSLPVKTETLVMEQVNVSRYTIYWDGDRKFFLGVVWKGDSTNPNPPVIIGVYGCDTSHICYPTKMAYFPNVPVRTYDILSWADTSKRIY
jgi:hypothetical protein